MPLTRRKLLTSMTALGAAAAFPSLARADDSDDGDSIWDILSRNARKKDVDPDKNTTAARRDPHPPGSDPQLRHRQQHPGRDRLLPAGDPAGRLGRADPPDLRPA